MKTPKFWQNKNIISLSLFPLGIIYSFVTNLRMKFIKPKKVSVPVICIGNLTAGGTGKTPVCISIAKILKDKGKNPFFISRGYGGNLKNIIVDKTHKAKDVGDEPILLSQEAPVAIGSDRYIAAKLAIKNGADVLIMDDGFQNPSLHKDLSFVVVDGGFGFGNKLPVPAGPLREDIKSGLKRCDSVIIIGIDEHKCVETIGRTPYVRAMTTPTIKSLKGTRVIAFAGIGRPEKFYYSLKLLEAQIIETINFADHHFYKENELLEIIKQSQIFNAKIYTTSKDYVKIPEHLQEKFHVLDIEIEWKHQEEIIKIINKKLKF